MSVVRGVGGVYDMCMSLARSGMGGVGVRGLGLGFTNPGGTWRKRDMCLCFGCGGVGGVRGVDWRLASRSGRMVLCLCVVSLDSLCSWQVQVSVYCTRRIFAYLRCTQCSILLQLIIIMFI